MAYGMVLGIFFVSGALGLGYQVLWSKVILNFTGVSAVSYSIVLAAFMGGLAIGSAIFGKLADRISASGAPSADVSDIGRVSSPLKWYAYLEFAISLYALSYLSLTTFAENAYARWMFTAVDPAGGGYPASSIGGLWAKGIVAAVLLLPPTICMGGTFPLLLKQVTENAQTVGRRAAHLYGINAAGAVVGALAMAYVMIPVMGMANSLTTLAVCNGLIAVAALIAAGVCPGRTASPSGRTDALVPDQPPSDIGSDALSSRGFRLCFVLIFAEGLISFVYEIAWTRFFGVVLGSSTYSFAAMLASFIAGIALGSACLARLERRIRSPLRFFGFTQVLAGLFVLVPLPFYPYLSWVFACFGGLLSTSPGAFYIYEFGKLAACCLIMLPPAIFLGMSLPLMVKAVAGRVDRLGENSGRVYAWNTLGNVMGAMAGGLFLLTELGMEGVLRAGAVANIFLGIVVVAVLMPPESSARKKAGWTAAGALILTAIFLLPGTSWDRRWFTLAAFRRPWVVPGFQETKDHVERRRVLLFKDDPAAHIMVAGESDTRLTLYVNGKPDASSHGDLPTHILLAHLPILLHPSPEKVCIVGLASGVTGGSALLYPVQSLDIVELVRSMPEATRFFSPWNGNVLGDTRVRLVVDDARSYLSHTSRKYDVIISEPSNPWVAGVGALFSRDFYERAKRSLDTGGIYCQWIQSYEMSDELFAAVIRGFRLEFPYVYGFQINVGDFFLLGSATSLRPNWARMEMRFSAPAIRDSLSRIQIHHLADLLYFQRFSPPTVDFIAALAERENTDDNLILEYGAPRNLFQKISPTLSPQLDERLISSPSLFWRQYLRARPADARPMSETSALGASETLSRPMSEASALGASETLSRPMSEASALGASETLSRPMSEASALGASETLSRPVSALRILAYERAPFEKVAYAHLIASFHLKKNDISHAPWNAISHFPETFFTHTPLSESMLDDRMRQLLGQNQNVQAAALIEAFAPAILLEAATSHGMAGRWEEQINRWAKMDPESPAGEAIRMLRIEHAMSTGRMDDAARDLDAWVRSAFPPPPQQAIVRAGQIDFGSAPPAPQVPASRTTAGSAPPAPQVPASRTTAGGLRSEVLRTYLERDHPIFVERIAQLLDIRP